LAGTGTVAGWSVSATRPHYRFTMWRVQRSVRRMAEELEDMEAVVRLGAGYGVRLPRRQAMRLRRRGVSVHREDD
jgi:hypothetical protein